MKIPAINIISGNCSRLYQVCESLDTEKRWQVNIKEWKESISDAQRRTVHGWFRFISQQYAEATGKHYSPASWKIYFKERFGLWNEIETLDGIKTELKSLADYKMPELSKLMDDINHFCGSEFNIFVPIPGEPME